jgi:hypothetical protein
VEHVQLVTLLDGFGNRLEPEGVGEPDRGLDDRAVLQLLRQLTQPDQRGAVARSNVKSPQIVRRTSTPAWPARS